MYSVTDGGGDTIRVLHVDDEPDQAELTAAFLTREDDRFTIEMASNASDGLNRLSETQFDCVISDYDMPDQTGIEFLKAVREEYPDLPFILYTGEGSEKVASDAISAGVTDYLQKESGTDQYTILANRVRNAVERYRIEREVEHTRAQLKAIADKREQIIERVTDAIVEVDSDWRFTLVNEQAEDLYEMSEEYLLGRDFWDVFEEAKDTRFEKEYQQVMETREPTSFVEYFSQLDGWFDIEAYPKQSGGIAFYFIEVTEYREREQELEAERTFISEALDTLDDAFFVVGTDGELQRWNKRVTEVTGYSETELSEMNVIQMFPENEREVIANAIKTTLETGLDRVEADVRTADGTRIPYEFAARCLTDSEGEVLGIAGIGRDISDRKQREKQLEMFASVVSHDLRNPLSVAEGYVELAQEECDSDYLDRVARAHDRMHALIENLLTLAREGEEVGDTEPVDLASLTETCWENIATAEATLSTDIDRPIRADQSRSQELLENLMRNAVEHGGDNVTVTVGGLENGFYVEDNGPGISENERDDVFNAGYTTAKDGTGFGLSIVKQIADAHDWKVRVIDGSDGGARFEITGVESAAE
ncbi:PAS domain S-box protein [Halalkalicoccus sp. GCM10025322]|uniref:PAS domain S-box protein n=1 Tax=Halalkalicoccus TaxID=332246 RepID=UPI002F96E6E5